MAQNIIRYTTIGLIFLAPACALIFTPSMFFPYITGKNLAFRFLIDLALVGWIVLAFIDAKYRPRFSWIAIAVLAFVIVMGIATALGVSPPQSFWSNFERMKGYINVLHMAAFFLVAINVLNTERLWGWFFHISIGVSVAVGLHAMMTGSTGAGGLLGNQIYLAIYALFHAFLALMYMIRRIDRSVFVSIAYAAIIVLQLAVVVLSDTRGTVLGLVIAIGMMALLYAILEKERRVLKYGALTLVIIGVIGAGIGTVALTANNTSLGEKEGAVRSLTETMNAVPIVSEFVTLDLTDVNSATTRFYMWESAYEGFKDRPILGWGVGNFQYVFIKYYPPEIYEREPWFDRSHNVYLDWLVYGGVIGLLSYLSMWVALLWVLWRDPNATWSMHDKIIMTGMLVAYFVHNFFVFDSYTSHLLFFAILGYVAARSMPSEGRPLFGDRSVSPAISYGVVAPVLLVAVLFMNYHVHLKTMWASESLISALRANGQANQPAQRLQQYGRTAEGLYKKSLADLKRSLSYDAPIGTQEIREQVTSVARQIEDNQRVSDQFKERFLNFARPELNEQVTNFPNDIRPHIFWGLTLMEYGNYDKAIPLLEHAHKRSPTKQSIMVRLARAYIGTGQYDKAEKMAKKILELTPDHKEGRLLYASVARYQGNEEKSEEILSSVSTSSSLFNEQLLQPYINTGQYDKVIEIRKERIDILEGRMEERGKNARRIRDVVQEMASLAALYAREDQTDAARKLLERAKEDYPRYSDQIDQFLKRLDDGKLKQLNQ